MQEEQVDISKLSTEELEQILAKRKKKQRVAQEKKEQEYQNAKLAFINEQFEQVDDLCGKLRKLKHDAILKGNELHAQMYELFGKEEKEMKEFSILDKDGRDATRKITIQSHDILRMNETAEVHANAMRDIIKGKFYKNDREQFSFINDMMSKNEDGTWDAKVLVTAKKWEQRVNDPEYSKHLTGLIESTFVDGTALYVRHYRKNANNKKWEFVSLQFSSF